LVSSMVPQPLIAPFGEWRKPLNPLKPLSRRL
jgi:hypothetical protein